VIPRLGADAQWLTLHVGVKEEAEKREVTVFWRGPSGNQTVQEQIQLITEAMLGNAYGIIVQPATFIAENRVLDQALARGIPVVILAEKIALPPSPHLYYILDDTHFTGRLIAERLSQTVREGDIAILGLEPDVPGSMDRADSMEASLRKSAPGIHIVDKLTRAPSGSYLDQSVRQMIVDHPQLRAIVALSASEGVSAAAATRAAGARGHVKIIVCGQSIDVLLLLRTGIVDSIVVQPIREMGARAVESITADRNGRTIPHEVLYKATLVTLDNLDTEPVQQMLLMHRRPPW
jgi:ribose transport system substrate-binding protein